MSTKIKLLSRVFVRWIVVNALLMAAMTVWRIIGVEWVVTVFMFLFWAVQVIHVIYFAILLFVVFERDEK